MGQKHRVKRTGADSGDTGMHEQAKIPVPRLIATIMQLDVFLVSAVRTLVEVAGYSLLGQGVLALLAGQRRHENLFYKILEVITRPVIRAVRFITPRLVMDAHIPFLAFFILFWLWVALAIAKRYLCAMHGLQC
jgi:hypothetical protein